MFPSFVLQSVSHVVSQSRSAIACMSLDCFQDFPTYAEATGASLTTLGLDIQALWSKSPTHAAIGRQHRGDTPAQSQPNLLEWGLDPEDHVAAARLLRHPFAEPPQTELDLSFAVEAYACLGLRITDYRRSRLRILCKLAKAVRPLDEYLLARRHCKLEMAPGVRPVFCAMLAVILRWPDKLLAQNLALGFEWSGGLLATNILLPIAPPPPQDPGQ